MMIKRAVSVACRDGYRHDGASARKHRESTIWQRRFWEHQIRDDLDFERHADYIHANPVKHGFATSAAQWPYSTFHRYCKNGVYRPDWCGNADVAQADYD